MNIWDFINWHKAGMLSGETRDCSLLGSVRYTRNKEGDYVGVIPSDLQQAAEANGWSIISANFRENTYTLKLK